MLLLFSRLFSLELIVALPWSKMKIHTYMALLCFPASHTNVLPQWLVLPHWPTILLFTEHTRIGVSTQLQQADSFWRGPLEKGKKKIFIVICSLCCQFSCDCRNPIRTFVFLSLELNLANDWIMSYLKAVTLPSLSCFPSTRAHCIAFSWSCIFLVLTLLPSSPSVCLSVSHPGNSIKLHALS